MPTTQVFFEKYKGYPVVAIWRVDENGEKLDETPLVSFGERKARAILKHIDEIQKWFEQQDSKLVDLSDKSKKKAKKLIFIK